MTNNIIPIGAKCLVEPSVVAETSSGIIRADQGLSMPVKGKVLKAGAESQFKEGQELFFRRYSVDELKFPSEDGTEQTLWIIEDGDVVAVVI